MQPIEDAIQPQAVQDQDRQHVKSEQEKHPGQPQSTSRLEQRAREVAVEFMVATERVQPAFLLARLPSISRLLENAYRRFLAAAEQNSADSYAGEWLLDNFHIIRQTLRQVQDDLPQRYYAELPQLDAPALLRGVPRIYGLMRAFVVHDQCQVNVERLIRYLRASEQPLPRTIGEDWAAPIMLRFALLEFLAQAAARSAGLAQETPQAADPILDLDPSLRDADIVADCVQSLRLLDSHDWEAFFEEVNQTHYILCDDPAGVYACMDFDTRNRYRAVVEQLAHGSGHEETGIARRAVDLAAAALRAHDAADGADLIDRISAPPRPLEPSSWTGLFLPRQCHVGYYLVDKGRIELERRLAYRPRGSEWVLRGVLDHPALFYLGAIFLATITLIAAVIAYSLWAGGSTIAVLGAALVAAIPAITLAVNLVNWIITHTIPPRVLPKLNFADGIPPECHTMVVVPALIARSADVDSLVRQLELHYLHNPDPRLRFALLSDFGDASQTTNAGRR